MTTFKPEASIVVVSYNTKELTLACLRSVFEETRSALEVIVIDNASSDGSADAIAAAFGDRVQLIRSVTNLGFAQANNVASKEAAGDLLLLLNPDTVILDGAIDKLIAFARAMPDCGIWGGRTLYGDLTLNPASCWRQMSIWSLLCRVAGLDQAVPTSSLFNPDAYGGWKRDGIREVDIVSGCYFLIETRLWKRLGGFSAEFFMYGEEADLCLRARRMGAMPTITSSSQIVHYGGASSTIHSDRLARLLAAKILLIRHHWRASRRPVGVGLIHIWVGTRVIASALLAASRRSVGHEEIARVWYMVWRARKVWGSGQFATSGAPINLASSGLPASGPEAK